MIIQRYQRLAAGFVDKTRLTGQLALFLRIDKVATGSYIAGMDISVKEAKNKLTELLRRVEAGERVTITRAGLPVVDLLKHEPPHKGINWEALRKYKQAHGITRVANWVAPDFDAPLPEDFLFSDEGKR